VETDISRAGLARKRAVDAFDGSIDIPVVRLRHMTETDPGRPKVLKTVRCPGYRFVRSAKRQVT